MDTQKRLAKLRKIIVICVVLGIFGAGVGVAVGWYMSYTAVAARQDVIKKVPFQTYTVATWPDGFTIDANSTAYDDSAFVFTLSNGSSDRMSVSQQKMPDAAKLDEFVTKYLPRKQELSGTPYKSWISDFPPGGTILGVEAGDTWVVITTTKKQANTLLQEIAKNLQKI